MEDPRVLLRRLKLGREEYCQRLLTMLIVDGPYPRWNTTSVPSSAGVEFLRRLDAMSFGTSDLDDDVGFIDELDLPARGDFEKGAAPDYGVLTSARLWIIELKTEVGSHRASQMPTYFALGHHHHPQRRVDLTYLTPAMSYTPSPAPSGSRFAHLTWNDVTPLIREVWGQASGLRASVREALLETLGTLGRPWTKWREETLDDVVGLAVRQARLTAVDGEQRALDHLPGSLEEVQELRVAVRDALRASGDGSDVTEPWLWSSTTSGGRALSAAGRETGYELRFSRSRKL